MIRVLNGKDFTSVDFSSCVADNLRLQMQKKRHLLTQILQEVDEIKATNVRNCLEEISVK